MEKIPNDINKIFEKPTIDLSIIEKSISAVNRDSGMFSGNSVRFSGTAKPKKRDGGGDEKHEVPFTTHDDWTIFATPWGTWGVYWNRTWEVCVSADKSFNDAHFWLTSCPTIWKGKTFPPAPPGYMPWHVFWGSKVTINKEDVTYVDDDGKEVTKKATMVCFEPDHNTWDGDPPWPQKKQFIFL